MGDLQWLHTHHLVRRSKQSSWDGRRKKSVANPLKSTFRRSPTTRQSKSPTLLGNNQTLIEDEHPKFEHSRDFRGADIAHIFCANIPRDWPRITLPRVRDHPSQSSAKVVLWVLSRSHPPSSSVNHNQNANDSSTIHLLCITQICIPDMFSRRV